MIALNAIYMGKWRRRYRLTKELAQGLPSFTDVENEQMTGWHQLFDQLVVFTEGSPSIGLKITFEESLPYLVPRRLDPERLKPKRSGDSGCYCPEPTANQAVYCPAYRSGSAVLDCLHLFADVAIVSPTLTDATRPHPDT